MCVRADEPAGRYAAYLDDEENKRKRERPTDAFETLYQQMEDLVDDLVQKVRHGPCLREHARESTKTHRGQSAFEHVSRTSQPKQPVYCSRAR